MNRPLRYVTGRQNPYVTFAWMEVVPAQALPAMYELEVASLKRIFTIRGSFQRLC